MHLYALAKDFVRVLRLVGRSSKREGSKSKIQNPVLWIVLVVSLLLSGCVNYDVGVNFYNANGGEFVQHIKLEERLTSFSGDSVYEWLNSIERRARKLEGKTRRVSNEEVIVSIPFSSGRELQTKFNEFFHPSTTQTLESIRSETESQLPQIDSNLLLFQNNFLLLVRNRLVYDLDLRSLALLSSKGNVLASPGSILDLEFGLNAPWGARNVENTNVILPEKNGNQLMWKLKTGELNHIEVVFWLPSPLGFGTLFIILFVWAGFYLRYTFMPDPRIQFVSQGTVTE
ncbi:MAG: DUF3153 domain-containing protein [Brasilonema octagenarum HA4186-MV1]|jgi:hypothetical protein|uniref:DUF3153 domain-containing protein n=2 Tax=Brasilonema TaxID=383614 RepID=A0A856M9V3_9CYAN|nr:DUF3153 domain-containing protein [Brasilonema octagenarum]MBW4627265.1 DUF3153 domain-containing protein [Brasilonema octagenarum HA4186-MV1]NMF62117.1 DUF3153 domain-containing protein [Brasilonema octagenarum UFV-OR1]QDL06541.1 DUF3153 domain-containing protein [Brasilonema sennae CENA114]QDL12912.1 DUF3153 domain-containing protein [Brasilonema octagenarum UFV-E1]